MARTLPHDARSSARSSRAGSRSRNQAHFHPEVASLDDLVFLPANLSRLVIDPYRDACRVATALGARLELAVAVPRRRLRRRRRGGAQGGRARRHGARARLRRPAPDRRRTCRGCSCSATGRAATPRRPPRSARGPSRRASRGRPAASGSATASCSALVGRDRRPPRGDPVRARARLRPARARGRRRSAARGPSSPARPTSRSCATPSGSCAA